MLVKFDRINQSIKLFLRFLLVSHSNNIEPIRPYRNEDLYQAYKAFCEDAKVNYYHKRIFCREMTKMGILDVVGWDKEKKRNTRMRDLSEESVMRALRTWVDNSDIQVSIMDINGVYYRVTMKLEKLDNQIEELTSVEPKEEQLYEQNKPE